MPHRIDTPVRGERVRCAVARVVFVHCLIFYRLALWLAPTDHPWRHLTESTHEEMKNVTEITLRPRNRLGYVQAVMHGRPPTPMAIKLSYAVMACWLVYAVVARSTDLVPPLLPVYTEGEDAIFSGRQS